MNMNNKFVILYMVFMGKKKCPSGYPLLLVLSVSLTVNVMICPKSMAEWQTLQAMILISNLIYVLLLRHISLSI